MGLQAGELGPSVCEPSEPWAERECEPSEGGQTEHEPCERGPSEREPSVGACELSERRHERA